MRIKCSNCGYPDATTICPKCGSRREIFYGDCNPFDFSNLEGSTPYKRPVYKTLEDIYENGSEKEIRDYVMRKHGLPVMGEEDERYIKTMQMEIDKKPKGSAKRNRAQRELDSFKFDIMNPKKPLVKD